MSLTHHCAKTAEQPKHEVGNPPDQSRRWKQLSRSSMYNTNTDLAGSVSTAWGMSSKS